MSCENFAKNNYMSHEDNSMAYLECLGDIFKYLSQNVVVNSKAQSVSNTAKKLYSTVAHALRNRDKAIQLSIDPNIHIPIPSKTVCSEVGHADLFIGGELIFENRKLKRQALVVTVTFRPASAVVDKDGTPNMIAGRNHVVRRFHFDFDSELLENDRPVFHLQYGGKFKGEYLYSCPHAGDGFDYVLMREMDQPRLPFPPADFGTIMDALIHQFGGPLGPLVNDSAWVNKVSSIEKIWMKEYFESALAEINQAKRVSTLYKHYCKWPM